jgi:hypothetical protein
MFELAGRFAELRRGYQREVKAFFQRSGPHVFSSRREAIRSFINPIFGWQGQKPQGADPLWIVEKNLWLSSFETVNSAPVQRTVYAKGAEPRLKSERKRDRTR